MHFCNKTKIHKIIKLGGLDLWACVDLELSREYVIQEQSGLVKVHMRKIQNNWGLMLIGRTINRVKVAQKRGL